MDKKFWRRLTLFLVSFFLVFLCLYWIVKDDWKQTAVLSDPVNREAVLSELREDGSAEQEMTVLADRLEWIELPVNLQAEFSDGAWMALSLERNGEPLAEKSFRPEDITKDGTLRFSVNGVSAAKAEKLALRISGNGGMVPWYGSSKSAGKFDVKAEDTEAFSLNGNPVSGMLVYRQSGSDELPYMSYYWYAVLALGILCAATAVYAHNRRIRGKPMALNHLTDLCVQYRYLLKTLVVRDFRVKYKASVLGMLWSFLNPLLMTFVYMFVFSTIFNSSIEHFVVYLMSGIVLYNYFTESTNLGMQSIVGNAALITKVYIPKYVFPISKAISAGINLTISLIPLLIMMLLTGVPIQKSMLLLPVLLLFLILFCVGLSMILSAAMVYFRDLQFLWGIVLTVLNFLSPIFYPESIIPARFITLYHMNPLYQYLFFMRTITLGGISPTPITYLYCMICSAAALILGILFFRKTQSRFVLHL